MNEDLKKMGELILQIAQIAKQIYEAVELAKANVEQSQILAKRIKVVVDQINQLQAIIVTKPIYKDALTALRETLEECLEFITSFKKKNWLEKVVFGGSHAGDFQGYHEKLQRFITDLNLGVGAENLYQQVANHEADQLAAQKDSEALKKILAELSTVGSDVKKVQAGQDQFFALFLQRLTQIEQHREIPDPIAELQRRHRLEVIHVRYEKMIGEDPIFQWHVGSYFAQRVFIKKAPPAVAAVREQFLREVAVLSRLRHSGILEFYGACFDPGHEALVFQSIKGSLTHCIQDLTPAERIGIAKQIASALYYLHSKQIIHGALSSDHVMVTEDHCGKLTGFGFAETHNTTVKALGATVKRSSLQWLPIDAISLEKKLTAAVDIYSFGLLLVALFSNTLPYHGVPEATVMEHKKAGKLPPIPGNCDPVIQGLIVDCCKVDASQRPSITDITDRLQALKPIKVEKTKLPSNPAAEKTLALATAAEKQNDMVAARQNYELAITQGSIEAKTNLAFFYVKKLAGLNDATRGFQLFNEAADVGHPRAMFNVGLCHHKGVGTPVNLQLARQWYEKAKAAGFADAQKGLDKLK